MPSKKIFNANTQKVETADLSVDKNAEIIATFADGSFLKFPAGLTKEEFEVQIELVKEANRGQEVITQEAEAEQNALIENSNQIIGNSMPEADITNAPSSAED